MASTAHKAKHVVYELNGEPPTYAIGQRLTWPRIGLAEVYRIHAAGTLDVEATDGRCYRITGLYGTNWGNAGRSTPTDRAAAQGGQ